ncbi:response regulator [Streptomyces yangpuensis]|uniref:response regulator n=1 Tax=Streptomyces yangpuensis TaxID=1648182 RepID=UPI003628EFFD
MGDSTWRVRDWMRTAWSRGRLRLRFRPRIWHKLAAICLAFMIPLVLTGVYLVREQNSRIYLAHEEIDGLKYLKPVQSLLQNVSLHRTLVRQGLNGETVSPEQIAATEKVIDRQFATLEAVDRSLQYSVQTSGGTLAQKGLGHISPASLAAEWRRLKFAPLSIPASEGEHDKLTANLLGLTTYVGDTAKLLLDPNLATSYTLIALSLLQPQITHRLNHLGAATGTAQSPGATTPSPGTVTDLSAILTHDMAQLRTTLDQAAVEIRRGGGAPEARFQPMVKELDQAVTSLARMSSALASPPGQEGASQAAYARQLSQVADANARLWDAVWNQANELLQDRARVDAQRRVAVLSSIAAVLAVTTALTLLVGRRMVKDLGNVAQAAESLSGGNLDRRVQVKSRDEIATVAGAFNAMAARLEQSYAHIERKVRLRTRELDERNASLKLLEGVASAANVAGTPQQASRSILTLVCSYTGWPAGQVRFARPSPSDGENGPVSVLAADAEYGGWYCADAWRDAEFRSLLEAVLASPLVPGAGEVQQGGRPAWILDIDEHPGLAAARRAASLDVRTYLVFPILQGESVEGVLEFLAPGPIEPDEALCRLMLNVGTQLGRALERSRAAEELRVSQRNAEVANRAKSAFLATMSHEIRTPLNSVIGMTDLLLDTPLQGEQQDFTKIIRESGENLLVIINDILDFSKIEAGKLTLEYQPVDLRQCIESTFDLVSGTAARKNLDLAYIITPGTQEHVMTDRVRLRQVIGNLLSNAVKFTESGEVVLTLGPAEEPANGNESPTGRRGSGSSPDDADGESSVLLHFAIRDTGIGIPADRMNLLFHAFEQLDTSISRRFEGTGLGLAISRRLTELMGGTMWAESTPGEGSTFHFTIRAQSAPAPVETHVQTAVSTELRGKRMLVVDDNATNRMILTLQGESWGMVVRATRSPAEAMEWIRRGDPFDVGILDYHMPETNGVELARAIHELRGRNVLPLILLSSVGRQSTQDLDEFESYHTKPIKASRLGEELCKVLQAPETSRSPSSPVPPPGDLTAAPRDLRILVAEDNEPNRLLLLRMLKKIGYTAHVAHNGRQALEALRERPFDVVLMDVQMPEMDGLEASRRIHGEWPADTRPTIIAMTANAMPGDREQCLAAGMDDYITKPLHLQELARALDASQTSGRRTGPPGPPAQPPAQDGAEDSGQVLNSGTVQRLVESLDADFVAALVRAFLEDAPPLVEAIREVGPAADTGRVRRAAHTLRSNALTFGAPALASLCADLEAQARDGALEYVEPVVSRIEAEYGRVEVALQKLQAELGPPPKGP